MSAFLNVNCLLIILLLLHCTWHVSIKHCTDKPTFVLPFIYMCDIIWPPAPFQSCYLARNLKEVARACPTAWNCHLHPSFRFSGSSNHLITGEFVSSKIIAFGYVTQRPTFVFASVVNAAHCKRINRITLMA